MSDHLNDCDCCQRKLTALRIAGTIDGIHLRQRDAYRDVLTDLIEALQPQRGSVDGCASCQDATGACPAHYGYAANKARDRAETRLREVTGNE